MKFKIGDRVEVTTNTWKSFVNPGDKGVIRSIGQCCYRIEMDNYIDSGHRDDCKYGYGWNLNDSEIRLVRPKTARVGDYIKVLTGDGHSAEVGKIYRVIEDDSTNTYLCRGWIEVDLGTNTSNYLRDTQYEVVDKPELVVKELSVKEIQDLLGYKVKIVE